LLLPSAAVIHAAMQTDGNRAVEGSSRCRLAPLVLISLACGLIAAGLGLGWLEHADTDLPPLRELVSAADHFYLPELRGERNALWLRDHHAVADAWQLAALRSNGQWDARVSGIIALIGQALAAAAVGWALVRCVGSRRALGLLCGAFLLLAFSPVGPRPGSAALGSGLLIALSIAQLLCCCADPGRRVWPIFVGLALGVLNVCATTLGALAAVSTLVWLLVSNRGLPRSRTDRIVFFGNAALVTLGAILCLVRNVNGAAGFSDTEVGASLLAWPFANAFWSWVVWAPSVWYLVRWVRGAKLQAAPPLLALTSIWVALLAATSAVAGDALLPSFAEIGLLALAVNAACFTEMIAAAKKSAGIGIGFALWIIAIANGLLFPAGGANAHIGPERESAATAALRRAVTDRNTGPLRGIIDLSAPEIGRLDALLRDDEFRNRLPASVRPAISIRPENPQASTAFREDAAPLLPGRDDLPAFGTWTEAGATATGEFISQPIVSTASVVQIRVTGELRPPVTSLVLRTASGEQVVPYEGNFASLGRWKRINFPAPTGPFRIVAHDAGTETWLAFTAPQEIGAWSRISGKLVRSWPWWLCAGLACSLGALAFSSRRVELDSPHENARPDTAALRKAAPWLALFAYAVFFSHHLDTTAGLNDSGGYLDSAKTLVGGHVTAAPRTLPSSLAAGHDVSLYLPTTFHPSPNGRMAPEYPVGFPLVLCAVAKLTSLGVAVPLVILGHLVFGVWLTRRLAGAMGLPRGWAWLAAGIIALSPVYLFQALQPQSDGPALVWVTAAVWLAWESRERPWLALPSGLATALAVLIRPADVLCVIPILVCLVGRWRQVAAWMLAGLPGALWWMWYNRELYGNAFTTGYGDVASSFGAQFVWPTLKSYALWLPLFFTPVVVLALTAPFLSSVERRRRWMLASWAASFAAFYATYWCTNDNWYNMRFLLPSAPALVVLGLLALRALLQRRAIVLFESDADRRGIAGSTVLATCLLGLLIGGVRERRVTYWMHANRAPAEAALWTRDHLPAGAVVFAKPMANSLMYYTELIFVRSDHSLAQTPGFIQRIAAAGHPVYALTCHWESPAYQPGMGRGDGRPALPGRWERVAVLAEGEMLVWKWQEPAATSAQ
jgi:hypothetical protein